MLSERTGRRGRTGRGCVAWACRAAKREPGTRAPSPGPTGLKGLGLSDMPRGGNLSSTRRPAAHRLLWVLALLVLAILLGGCRRALPEDVAALVDGRPISTEHLRRAAQLTNLIREATPQEKEVLKKVLRQLIREELILEDAERLGLMVTEAELAQRMDEIRADYPDQTFEDTLIKDFQLKDEWKEQVRRTMLIEKAFQMEVRNRIRPDPKAWRSLYETHRAELVKPMAVRFLHITTDSRAKTEKARQRVLSGEDFERVTRDNRDPKAALLQEPAEWIDPRYLPEEVRKAVEATPPGRISPVVESEYGYSIFKVLEVRPSRPMTLEEAAAHLRRQYQALMETRLLEEWLTRLEEKAKIRIQPGLS